MSTESQSDGRRPRSARHVRAAAKILQREGRKILGRHVARLPREAAKQVRACVAELDKHRDAGDWPKLEQAAERLDELLHQHASFARKSALRETLENVVVAVLIALGLRSCLYEPFKIPSGSMMPTLLAGDHIFVNKFIYGIQIPFTTTVVGEGLGDIQHGDVVVFRYPLDQSEDFIKRVMALPGDEIRVDGQRVAVKRAGEDSFRVLPHTPLDQPCKDESGSRVVEGCVLFLEDNGERQYVVRYLHSRAERPQDRRPQVRTVPEGSLLVMGDNRDQSHDSLAWTVTVEAVSAEALLTLRDLRDLTDESLFTVTRPRASEQNPDPHFDRVSYLNDHRAPEHDLRLSVWRAPTLGAQTVFSTRKRRLSAETVGLAELIEGSKLSDRKRQRLLEAGAPITDLAVAERMDAYDAIVRLGDAAAVIELTCGRGSCSTRAALAKRIANIVKRFLRDHDQDARDLLDGDRSMRYVKQWTGRSDPADRHMDRTLRRSGTTSDRDRVRLRAWRHPEPDAEWLRDAALDAVASSRPSAAAIKQLGDDAWVAQGEDQVSVVRRDTDHDIVFLLECGAALCGTRARAVELAKTVIGRLPQAATERAAFPDLLRPQDVSGTVDATVNLPDLDEYDRIALEGTTRSPDRAVDVAVWLRPEEGLAPKVAAVADEAGATDPDDSVRSGGRSGRGPGDIRVFAVPESEAVVRIRCSPGICPQTSTAVAMARRAADNAADPTTFVDPAADRAQPFVPRGNVKGRAERIWLPLSRFWLPVR